MKPLCRSGLVLAGLLLGACERAKSPPPDTSTRQPQSVASESTAKPPAVPTWDANAGPVLLVSGDVPTKALVFVPDSTNSAAVLAEIPRPASVTLFGRNGTVQIAEAPAVSDTGACYTATLAAAPPPRPWSIGFIGGVVSPIAMDSTEALVYPDSVALTTGVTRLASALPNDAAGRFSGLPFVVRSIWRFSVPQGPQVIAATLVRQINQEATPLQERTLLIAERPVGDTSLTTVYTERTSGNEETVETRDVVAAVLFGNRRVGVVVSHDFGDSVAYSLVERDDGGTWRVRWVSPRRHC